MVQVRGYTEDDVDVLSEELVGLIETALTRTVMSAADALHASITASVAFHLPGKHDQKTHGRSRTRTITPLEPYGDWGGQGKSPWMASRDMDVRAAGIWSESYEGQRAVTDTMRGLHRGELAPEQGVKIEGPLQGYAKVFDYNSDEVYGEGRVRDDIFNAATHLDDRLTAAPTVHATLFRGMRVESPEKKLRVGDSFDSDISSWTTHEGQARHYTSPQPGSGRPAGGKPVVMRITGGAKAVNLDDGSLPKRLQGSGEHLVRGTFRIKSAGFEGDTYVVEVEQLWQTA